jgi:hypothetical protein
MQRRWSRPDKSACRGVAVKAFYLKRLWREGSNSASKLFVTTRIGPWEVKWDRFYELGLN